MLGDRREDAGGRYGMQRGVTDNDHDAAELQNASHILLNGSGV